MDNHVLLHDKNDQCKHSLKRNRYDDCQYVDDELLYISSIIFINHCNYLEQWCMVELMDPFLDLLLNKQQCFRLLNQGNHGPKSDLALLNNRKRCRLIAKQIYLYIAFIGAPKWCTILVSFCIRALILHISIQKWCPRKIKLLSQKKVW